MDSAGIVPVVLSFIIVALEGKVERPTRRFTTSPIWLFSATAITFTFIRIPPKVMSPVCLFGRPDAPSTERLTNES